LASQLTDPFSEPSCGGREASPDTCTLSDMSPSLIVADCPECRGIRTVILGVCDVCFAEFGENHDPEPWHDGPRLARTA
jgi:hypothetical protein